MTPDRRTHPTLNPAALRRLPQVLALALGLMAACAMAGRAEADETPPEAQLVAPLEAAMDATLTVHSADDADLFLGSAFLWGEAAEVAVTNAHVVKDATEVRLRDRAGHEEIGTVIARDESRDLAVIAVAPGRRGLSPAATAPGLGAEVWALGAPLGIEFTLTQGRISALDRQTDPAQPIRLLQHDAAVNPGSSGGPLVDDAGALVGMNAQIADGSRMFVGIAYAIPAADLARLVPAMIAETLPPLPKLGLRARPMDRQLAAILGLAPTGLLVDEVEAAGLADAAGLKAGDILLSVGGMALREPGDLAFAVEAAQAEGSATLAVLRDGKPVQLALTLAATEDGGLTLREMPAGPVTVRDYTLQGLGLTLAADATILKVAPNSPANFAGLVPGDRILMLDGRALDPATAETVHLSGAALFLVQGEGGSRHVLVDPYAKSGAVRPVGGANVLDPAVAVF